LRGGGKRNEIFLLSEGSFTFHRGEDALLILRTGISPLLNTWKGGEHQSSGVFSLGEERGKGKRRLQLPFPDECWGGEASVLISTFIA